MRLSPATPEILRNSSSILMYEFVLPASAVAEVTVSVVSDEVNVDPSLIVEDVPAASIRVICDFAGVMQLMSVTVLC